MSTQMRINTTLLEAYSRGEITRRDIQEKTGEPVGFGTLLGQLHAHNLPLPRYPSDPNSPGVQLVRRLTERGPRAG
ncbi:MAG TPA: hypothetical protein VIK30_14040 [Polyangia bacterium]